MRRARVDLRIRAPEHPALLAYRDELTLVDCRHSFKEYKSYQPIHTGGKATLSGDGTWLVSTLNEQALVTDIETGEQLQELKGVRTRRDGAEDAAAAD